jgi:hypothetical protein
MTADPGNGGSRGELGDAVQCMYVIQQGTVEVQKSRLDVRRRATKDRSQARRG